MRLMMLFFFNDTATTEIYTLSLHDALPISAPPDLGDGVEVELVAVGVGMLERRGLGVRTAVQRARGRRSEEDTSELQSRQYLVCRLLLEKKKTLYRNAMDRMLGNRPGVCIS